MSICSIVCFDANMGTASTIPIKSTSPLLKCRVDNFTIEIISEGTGTLRL